MNNRYEDRVHKFNAEQLVLGMQRMPSVLRGLGYTALREGQQKIISCVMGGQDTLGVLPTSEGKTLSFVAPTLALKWRTLVFSPLISLIRDQQQQYTIRGARVGALTSHNSDAMNMEFLSQWVRGGMDLLYVAPERLMRPEFQEAMRIAPPHMTVVDEAHCLSGWSDTFRSAYCVIGDFITAFNPQVVLALTATCPPEVEADVRRVLCIQQGVKVLHYPRRTNLDLRSSAWNGLEGLASMLSRKPVEGAAVVYCATQKGTETTADALQQMLARDVLFYHGGLTPASRSSIQDRFMNESDVIMCATNAFGMGVDKGSVRMVIHKDMAGSIEAQAQETGRGGRDGKYTLCHAFSDPESVRTHKFLIACSNPTFEDVRLVYQALVKNKDLEGKVMLTKDELAKRSGLKGFGMDAVLQVLKGAQVIESTKNERKEHLVRVKNMTDDTKLRDFMAAVRSCAVPASDNGFSFVLQDLEDLLGVSESVLKSRMRDWVRAGLIQHAPPERANPVKVVGSLRQVDAERVEGLRARAEAKLAVVRKYVDEVPDGEKHAFIEQCMGVT